MVSWPWSRKQIQDQLTNHVVCPSLALAKKLALLKTFTRKPTYLNLANIQPNLPIEPYSTLNATYIDHEVQCHKQCMFTPCPAGYALCFWHTRVSLNLNLLSCSVLCSLPDGRYIWIYSMIFNIIFKRSLSPTLMHGEDVQPPAHQLSDREDVPCDVCHGNKAPSVKSCLVCQASYCEIHLVPHQRDPALQRHRLTDPAIFNTSHLCRKHNKPLTMFCKQDHTPVCSKCTEGDHKHHKIVPMEKESRRVKVREKLLPLPCVFWEGGGGFPELTDFCAFFFSLCHFYIVWSSPDESEGDKVRHPTDDPGQAEKNGRHQKSSGSKQSRSLIGSKSQACNQTVHLSVYLFI